MRITVSVGRGTPLPWPVAIAFTAAGAGLIVVGMALGPVEGPGLGTGAIPIWLAVVIVVPVWVGYAVSVVRGAGARRRLLATAAVPAVLSEPPDEGDPAVAAVVIGRGRVPAVAVAATTLALAQRGWIRLHEVGDELVVSFDESPPGDGTPTSANDAIVLHALSARRDAATGDVRGPPLWRDAGAWWPDYVRAARAHAIAAGWLEPRLPFVGLMMASVITATVVGLAIFWYVVAFVGTILLANGIPHLLARASGYRLSPAGLVERARWVAFGRGLRERGGLEPAGPGAVAVWGPYLVYGVLLGAGPRAARALTPEVGRHTELPPDVVVISV